ncbi:MAG TPA: ATP-grasp domain-containing protein, partial [Terriglobales bacterium]|nr:ATP-grasp domain-containing protein [Terriglobales bacterium]
GTDRCHVLEDPWRDQALPLHFEDAEGAARQVLDFSARTPIHAVVAVGDRPTPTAARVAEALGLPGHPPEAADLCRDKYRSRERLKAAGLQVPAFQRFHVEEDPAAILPGVTFPCVVKPIALSGSRGVIRADTPEEFVAAFDRVRRLLSAGDVKALREETSRFIQVEEYIAGAEVAVEALVERGRLHILAIFDKPDPLTGPYFEETIYVTPSRHAAPLQEAVTRALDASVRALGLAHGPVHAEFRLGAAGVYVMEVAARCIGGLCARALRFKFPLVKQEMSLEEVLIRLALGYEVHRVLREDRASGVMMIPIPKVGFYEEVRGSQYALGTPGIVDLEITAKPQQKLVPLPEGSSYLGFLFARERTPELVEQALRDAHAKLEFVIAPELLIVK